MKPIFLLHFLCIRLSRRHVHADPAAPWSPLTAECLWKWHLSLPLTVTAALNIQDKAGSRSNSFVRLPFILEQFDSHHSPSCISPVFLSHLLQFPPSLTSFLRLLFCLQLLHFSSFSSSVTSIFHFPFPLLPHIPFLSLHHSSLSLLAPYIPPPSLFLLHCAVY